MMNSQGEALSQTAHEYVECANKGTCDRSIGLCTCLPGYEGAACERVTCPSSPVANGDLVVCGGHGTCQTASEIAATDHDNVYSLWDKDMSMACVCDPGFYGCDCGSRRCPYGTDPLYSTREHVTPRMSNFSFVIYTDSPTANITGSYSIVFYDVTGEDWRSDPIEYGATCADIILSLEGLPNAVVPLDSVRCVQWDDYQSILEEDEPVWSVPFPFYGLKFTLVFAASRGKLREPMLDINLDGNRPTLEAFDESGKGTMVQWFIYPNGYHGDEGGTDWFSHLCYGVLVTLTTGDTYDMISDLSTFEERLLQRCLGDADGDLHSSSEKARVTGHNYNWDYGSSFYPHLIKLVEATSIAHTDICNASSRDGNLTSSLRGSAQTCDIPGPPPGFFAALVYDQNSRVYRLLSRAAKDFSSSTPFVIFTTKGTLGMVSRETIAYTKGRPYSRTVYTTNSSTMYQGYIGNIDCETNPPNVNGATNCVQYGDHIVLLDPDLASKSHAANPKYLNIYRVQKVFIENGTPTIKLDMGINANYDQFAESVRARIYIFRPPTAPKDIYHYYSECAGRGNCNELLGECMCNNGYVGGDCAIRDLSFSQ
eukprot:CAMPEP_0182431770 /NCGR_PEP_ID=MMETSP1167-20130531/51552_1 /TAXON_ID=2988 /ORGANISM="Mallomonas Sp, Strain CCMP3275" /LENGTH=595 /DNA_ID=CAMNT_0024618483 /DNA_START=569 /DNA_END=2356 /DNA_ORIENTATION=+